MCAKAYKPLKQQNKSNSDIIIQILDRRKSETVAGYKLQLTTLADRPSKPEVLR